MRVLYLTPGCFDKGGISRYNRYQIRALREIYGTDRVMVHSLAGPRPGDFEEPFDVRWSGRGASAASKLEYLLRTYIAGLVERPDLIVSAHVNMSGVARALALVTRARTLLNVYGLEVWSGLRPDAAWGLRSVDHVISDCHFTARYLEREGQRPAGSVAVVWDCVDTERFYPAPSRREVLERYGIPDPNDGGVNLLTLGRMGPDCGHKGYERLLSVFGMLASRLPQLRLIYAGRGALADEIRRRAVQMGFGHRVYFTGAIHEADLPDVYRSAHIFSLVSDRGIGRGEGIPLTPLESAACGVPILVGNHDGSQEAVVEGVNGFVLDPFDLAAHAEAIERLATDEALRARMADAALQRIREEFAYPIFKRRHEELLARWFPERARADQRQATVQAR